MSRRRGLAAIVGVVVAVGVWLGTGGVAWGAYNVTPSCTVGGQASGCTAGWYTAPVQVSWTWTPNDGGMAVTGCVTQSLANDVRADLSCKVTGPSGTTAVDQPINVEMSNPTANDALARPPDSNGWYNHPVAVSFGGSAFSGIASCASPIDYAGPDMPSATVSGNCTDNAGKVASAGLVLNYDATPPRITAETPSRPPDHHGWYNHPVSFVFSGTDATSGIGSCANIRYAGPNSAGFSLTGFCADRAGNVTTLAVPFRYDSSPPALNAGADPGDALVALRWRTGGDVAPITSLKVVREPGLHGAKRSVIYRGHGDSLRDGRVKNGDRYTYTIKAVDQAGNVSERTIHITPGPRLLSPFPGAHTVAPPLLTWTPVRHADYYNVQLYQGRTKVLSIWPKHASLRLERTWRFAGHRYRLKPGRYRWYVWPGFGPRAAGHYGRLIGTGTFVIMRKT
jgi:hypothetical protein